MAVDGQPKQADGDINVGAGSIVNIDICLFYSISGQFAIKTHTPEMDLPFQDF
jgi:hypothetical protein